MACSNCNWPYPAELLSDFVSTAGGRTTRVQVCGICALDAMNAAIGVKRTQLRGQAELMRLDAIAWRNAHPAAAPKTKAAGG